MNTRTRWGLAALLLGLLGSCQSASEAANEAMLVTNPEYAQAVSAGETILEVIPRVFSADEPTSLAGAREQMGEVAGKSHFENEALLSARNQLSMDRPQFQELKSRLQNQSFAQARDRFRFGEPVGVEGSVRRALENTAELVHGVAVPRPVQPVLGKVLPQFSQD